MIPTWDVAVALFGRHQHYVPAPDAREVADMHCPSCTSGDIADFVLSPRGEALRFASCRNCEHRWWTAVESDVVVTLPDVLQEIAAGV